MIPQWKSRFELKPDAWVFVPTAESIKTGQEIKRAIESRWTPPPNYYHLLAGGHVEALRIHTDNTWFIHLDIKNFFGSINRSRATRCLKSLFGYKRAREIANLSTVIHPERAEFILPFGFVQSPIIASICLHKSALGSRLRSLRTDGFTVSVYMDDLIISSATLDGAHKALADIKHHAERSGFQLNSEKEEGPAYKITAFNIDLAASQIAIEPTRLKAFSEALESSSSPHQQLGILGYIKSVNINQYKEILHSQ